MKTNRFIVLCSPFLLACSQTQETTDSTTPPPQGSIQKEFVTQGSNDRAGVRDAFETQTGSSPSAGVRAESREAFTYPVTEVVHRVSTSEELRAALQNLLPHTDIVLEAGTYQIDGPTLLPNEPMEQVRIVGQGMDATRIDVVGRVPVLEWKNAEHSPMKFVFQELTIFADDVPFVATSGMGVIEINRARLEGKRVVDAPSCIARWRSQAEVPTHTPAVQVKSLQRIMGASHKKPQGK